MCNGSASATPMSKTPTTGFTKLDPAEWHKVRTRDGRKVRILCVDGSAKWPIVGVIEGGDFARNWKANGEWAIDPGIERPNNLILPPEPRTVWLRDYGAGFCPEASQAPLPLERYPYTDYCITLCEGQPPRIEEVE